MDDRIPTEKPLIWVGSCRRSLRQFPKKIRVVFGQALFDAQRGSKHPKASPLRSFGGSGVLEIIANDTGNTFRAVYTVKFAELVYVLHAFQKKSKSGIKTPPTEIEIVRNRLKDAEKHYAHRKQSQEFKGQG